MTTPPSFSGPVAVTAETGPLFGGAESPIGLPDPKISDLLPPHGYVEGEYFVSGILGDGRRYTTTVLVRKPSDPARFSGVVALETVHAQGPLGLWQIGHPAILQGGHAWVAVASQRESVEGPIKGFNPSRYASLHVPTETVGVEDEIHAALAKWGSSFEDQAPPAALFALNAVSNEILTQVGTAIRGGALAGLAVTHMIMGGASQTGHATLNYIRGGHPTARLEDGKPVFDGFLPMAAPSWTPIAGGDAAVIQVFAEGDFPLFATVGPDGYMGARPDSDAPDDRFRSYQVTASPHLPTRGLAAVREIPQLGLALEAGERLTQFPTAPFFRGALVNLIAWVAKGVTPPTAPAIEIAGGEIVMDEFGNAKGGLRSPYVNVPAARHFAARYIKNLVGVEQPFPAETMLRLYGSRADYLRRFDEGIDALVAGRWILAADGEQLKAEEAASPPF